MHHIPNSEIASLFQRMEVALILDDEKKNLFRILAYRKAAEVIRVSAAEFHDLWKENSLNNIPGIGAGMKGHLDELFKTGHVKEIEREINKFPGAVYLLQNVRGIGPKTAWSIISSPMGRKVLFHATQEKVIFDKLIQLCKEHKIASLPGFGEKSETEILEAIEKYKTGVKKDTRINLERALEISDKFMGYMKTCNEVKQVEVLGSLRRKVETIGDIDIAVATTDSEQVIKHFTNFKYTKTVLEKGENKASIEMSNGTHVDLRVVNPDQWGTMLAHFTGSKDHNVALREFAMKNGLSISEYGVKVEKGKKKDRGMKMFKDEASFYKFFRMEFIAPELRENSGEIEASLRQAQGKLPGLPKLVNLEDIKGDLHMHSSFNIEPSHDLGNSAPEELLQKAIKLGYEYLAYSEHNPSLSKHTKSETGALLKKKQELVNKFNEKYRGKIHIFNSLEVDILPSGELALEEEHLKYLDFITVSVHSSFEQSKETQTKRLLRALDFPKVKILGHPTGRLVQKRDEIKFDHEVIFKKCAARKIAVEISASPYRNDPPWPMLKDLKSLGVLFIINTDAHSMPELELMKFGVWNARKGWLEAKNVMNTRSLFEIKNFLLK